MTNFEFAQNLEESVKTSFNEDSLLCCGTYIDNLFEKHLIIEPRPDENSLVTLNLRSAYPEKYS